MKVVTEAAIRHYFIKKNDEKLVDKGALALETNHVLSANYSSEFDLIFGVCRSSFRKQRTYTVRIFLRKGKLLSMDCTCPVGKSGRCHHGAAVALYVAKFLSCTSVGCVWNRPPKSGLTCNKGLTIEELKPPSCEFSALSLDEVIPYAYHLKRFPQDERAGLQFKWLLGEDERGEIEDEDLIALIPKIETIVSSAEYASAASPSDYLKEKAHVTWDLIVKVAAATIGQASCPLWFEVREHRGSASVFGSILTNARTKLSFKALAGQIARRNHSSTTPAMRWGMEHEKDGIAAFEKWSKGVAKVQPTGAWLHESGLLVASPDGLVGPDGLLEVKCPYSLRKGPLREGIKEKADYVLKWVEETQEFIIDKDHHYYAQIQGQLFLTRRSQCYLCIWHPTDDPIIIRIPKDPNWAPNIGILLEWMCSRYISYTFRNIL